MLTDVYWADKSSQIVFVTCGKYNWCMFYLEMVAYKPFNAAEFKKNTTKKVTRIKYTRMELYIQREPAQCGAIYPERTSSMWSYSALRKYLAPLNFATFCHISGFKHKDIKLFF